MTLFNVAPFKEGIMGPKDYLKYFGNLEIAPFLGIHAWDHTFLREVANSKLSGMSFEGVVGKCGARHNLEMYKVKSRAWREKVVARYSLQYLQNLENQDAGIDSQIEISREICFVDSQIPITVQLPLGISVYPAS